jgi:trehalose 6-phosphate synthase
VRLSLRFVIPLLLALGAFAYISVPLADSLMLRWFVRDLDTRSSLIAATVQEPMATLVATRSVPRISAFFNRMLQDERLYGVGVCLDATSEPIATVSFPREINRFARRICRSESGKWVADTARPAARCGSPDRHRRHVEPAAHPRPRYELRSHAAARRRAATCSIFAALSAAIALITVVIAQLSWRLGAGWRALRAARAFSDGRGRRPHPSSVRSRATCGS